MRLYKPGKAAVFPIGAVVLISVFFVLAMLYDRRQVPKLETSSATEKSQLDYVNKVRADHKLPALANDPGLDKTAQLKAEDMARRHYWNHDTPDGKPFYDLAEMTRPGLQFFGENIGQCFPSNKALFDAYVASPEHLANILSPNYTLFGGATLYDATKNCFLNVNEFGG